MVMVVLDGGAGNIGDGDGEDNVEDSDNDGVVASSDDEFPATGWAL